MILDAMTYSIITVAALLSFAVILLTRRAARAEDNRDE